MRCNVPLPPDSLSTALAQELINEAMRPGMEDRQCRKNDDA